MKNILNFLSFMLESNGIGDYFRLTAKDKWEIKLAAHAQERIYHRRDSIDSETRGIRKTEIESIIFSQKKLLSESYYGLPINSKEGVDEDPNEMHFRIGVKSAEKFGPILQDANFLIAIKPDFLAKTWIVSLKTFKFQECWNDKKRDYLIIIEDNSTKLFKWNGKKSRFQQCKPDGKDVMPPYYYECEERGDIF